MNWITTIPIAHRGLHNKNLPENSIGSFEAAIAHGYAIELDVHRTTDNRLVIAHDADMLRSTGHPLVITKEPYTNLQALKLFETEYGISTLDEVLTLVQGQVPLLIELKTGSNPDLVGPLLLELLKDYNGEFAVMSFDPRIVSWFKKSAPEIICGLLSGTMKYPDAPTSPLIRIFLRSMVSILVCKPSFLAYDIDGMPSKAIRFWSMFYKVPLILWVIRSQEDQTRAKTMAQGFVFEYFLP